MSNGLFVIQEDLVSAKSRIEGLDKELSEAKARELKALDDLQTAQEDNCAWHKRAEKELRTLDAKLSKVIARLLPTEEKLREAFLQLEHTENRADNAEAAAHDAAKKLVLAEKEAKEAFDKMAAAEVRAQERVAAAETQAREAVEKYKSSPDFALECRKAVMDAFVQGFERCKRRLSRLFKLGDLGHLRPADDEETSDAEVEDELRVESAADEPMIVEDPATGPIIIEEPTTGPTAGDGRPGDR